MKSVDLLADADPVLEPNNCDAPRDCLGLRFDLFEVTKTVVDDLLPGERLEYVYSMIAATNFLARLPRTVKRVSPHSSVTPLRSAAAVAAS